MKGLTTLVLKELIAAVEKRRETLEVAMDVRGVVIEVTLKPGVVPPAKRRATAKIEYGDP